MRKLAWCAPSLLALFVGPFTAAAFLAAVQTPAVGVELAVAQCSGALPVSGVWRVPFTQAYALTSGYGQRYDPAYHRLQLHAGQDLASLPGPGPVVAAAAGTVVAAGPAGGLGNAVEVDHGGGVRTVYGHLAGINPTITAGATVAMGQPLGREGSTGASTGNHLHFEVHQGGHPVDPVPFMDTHGAALNGLVVPPAPPPASVTTAATSSPSLASTPSGVVPSGGVLEGGIGFALPAPGAPRLNSLTNPPLPVPPDIKDAYTAAADRYQVPWTLLAGIGMEETAHGRNTATSSAGAQGLMQFMPATWATYGVDGDRDGAADIHNPTDSAFSAANYLTASGVTRGPGGVRAAIFAYNHAQWYVNDVLYYAAAYSGTVLGDPTDCPGTGNGDPNLPPLSPDRVKTVLAWAGSHVGDAYLMGAGGPHTWDCSSFVQAAYRQIGISTPRTAGAQRDWLAAGNGYRVPAGQEARGDLVFTDSYLGPNAIGHVQIIWDPAATSTVEARSSATGVVHATYSQRGQHIFQVWRVGSIADHPSSTP